jgi:hypothetical protein
MNKKDLYTLMESCEKIFENTLSTLSVDDSTPIQNASDNISSGGLDSMPAMTQPPEPAISLQLPQDGVGADEHSRMTIANLRSMLAHGQKVLQAAEGGQEIEAWMNDKITVASNDILEVCNAIEFRN